MIREIRAVCVVLALIMAVAWLGAIFPNLTRSDDTLLFAVLASIGMFFVGAFCAALAYERVVHPAFAAAVVAAPLVHWGGAFVEGFWCLPFLIIPSVIVVYLGIRELCSELPSQ